jgi:hypothetical protein
VSCEFRNNQLVAFAEQRRGDFARRANLSQSALLIPPPNQNQNPRHPVPIRGAYRDVTDAGWDAMDAGGATDERAGLRTAKSCGPDAPTLASSFPGAIRASDGGNKPGHRGEREGNR